MNTDPSKKQDTSMTKSEQEQQDVQISLPRIDRPEGPFEHSGETARVTQVEKEEMEQRKETD